MPLAAAAIGCIGLCTVLAASPTSAQPTNDLQTRVQRLERDLRDLQAATFKRPPGSNAAPADALPDNGLAAPAPEVPMVDLGPLMRRMDELGDSLGRLTGQMEELGHQVDQLSQKADRLQKEMDLQTTAQGNPAPPEVMPQSPPDTLASANPPGPAGPTLRPYAPPSGVLGTLPLDARPSGRPAPLPPDLGAPIAQSANDTKREFDAAMNLLARAQYESASQAFRTFADAHPEADRASDALYWTGDIAYSTKKDYDEAARDFAELLKKYPNAPHAPEGMLKLGLSLFELSQTKEGCAALAALPAKYPDASQPVATRARNARRDNKCR